LRQPTLHPRIFPIMNAGKAKPKDDTAFANTEPSISTLKGEPRTLFDVRRKSRRLLAERYEKLNPQSLPPGLNRYPKMQRECYIESISLQPDVLKSFHEKHEKGAMKVAKKLARMLRNGRYGECAMYAEELALIASDPEIYGKGASVRALRALVVESLEHSMTEAKGALASLGFDIEKMPRTEIVALTSSPIRLLLHEKLRDAMRSLERQLEERG